ncbi:MAG: 30S ribosomal protein S12 methylthiotransferase RimO [Spirochaetales bacterium]|nr:30S ribosomal protein S12 methylthiotransferase RimO [Spirochaetales bacterium]
MIKFFIESLGCSKNQVDSETIITLLENRGYVFTGEPQEADLILVNTCGFINAAKQESLETVMEFRSQFPDKKIIMTGCLSERYFIELEKDLTEIDGIWGTGYSTSFADFVDTTTGYSGSDTPGADASSGKADHAPRLSFPGSAYVKIAEGCINKCTYCAIPIIRGDLQSRPKDEILQEVNNLLSMGIQEINLVAQDSASYGTDIGSDSIVSLIQAILEINADFWLRVLYLHPDKFPKELLAIAERDSRFLPYFDIPFQHGSPRILHQMGRKGSNIVYEKLVADIRTAVPKAIIRTTFLTGFPGETDKDVELLKEFQRSIQPNWAGIFTYSHEEGTPAYSLSGQIPAKTAGKRKQLLEKIQEQITASWLKAMTGQTFQVLVEERVQGEDLLLGRTWFQAPEVDGLVVIENSSANPGERITVRITGVRGVDLTAIETNSMPGNG